MIVAYADPPYPGQAKRHYEDHRDYAGEVDHEELVTRLVREYPDGWALSTSSTALRYVLSLCPTEARVAAWVKPFAEFKNQRVTMAWEPVIYVGRKGVAEQNGFFLRDWVFAMPPIFSGRHTDETKGEKPREFSYWLFSLLGLTPEDELHDLYPGSGAVASAWRDWCAQRRLAA